ncbi:MAG: hypothetical protein A3G25_20725 [Betaproteobacteria bacterium RIFCSPLOWO2_12_FULL_63_13]|nr:MAG: hypothetical protein A3G25_20725 [Betaproteobacteria bacterium RIFCSPLOWO2_12_FULL_63_13]
MEPAHDHVHGPEPETELAEPELHSSTLGAEETALPSLEPQTPFTGTDAKLAEQNAFEPPSDPAHDHAHGPDPETELADPELHSPALGAEDTVPPSLEPQAPLTGTGARFAEQDAVEPPLEPEHDHVHGPEPETELADPELHSPALGAEDALAPSLEPQAPLTGTGARLAEQDAVEPPLEPEHDHVHGPEPETELATPELHSPALGAEDTLAPLLGPQAPLTWADEFAEQFVDVPPF